MIDVASHVASSTRHCRRVPALGPLTVPRHDEAQHRLQLRSGHHCDGCQAWSLWDSLPHARRRTRQAKPAGPRRERRKRQRRLFRSALLWQWPAVHATAGDVVTRRSAAADLDRSRLPAIVEICWLRVRRNGVEAAYCEDARKTARRVGQASLLTRVTLVPPDPPLPTQIGGAPHQRSR